MGRVSDAPITSAEYLGKVMDRVVIPTVNDLVRRHEQTYPVVRLRVDPDRYECGICGRKFAKDEVVDVLVLAGRHHGHPDDDSPDEYAQQCPRCGSMDSVEPVTEVE